MVRHRLLVPIDNADAFDTALKTLGSLTIRVRFASHDVSRKETLADDCQAIRQPRLPSSQRVNDLKDGKVIAGQTLKIPEISGQLPDKVLLAASRVDRPETDFGRSAGSVKIVYRVRAGETLSSISPRRPWHAGEHASPRLNNPGRPGHAGEGSAIGDQGEHPPPFVTRASSSGRRLLYTVSQRRHCLQHFAPVSGLGVAAQELEWPERASSDQSGKTTGDVR